MSPPDLAFASPRRLPRAASLRGRVVVLDIAFASEGLGEGFAKTTGKFIDALGPRLARWVDHHDHPMHAHYAGDPRFVLCTKQEHGACPEMIDADIVAQTGPVDTILAHFDLDGVYSAAKWLLGGRQPYVGADDDARAVDTRIGAVSATAARIDEALRAHYADPVLKIRIVNWLVGGMRPGIEDDAIAAAAADGTRLKARAEALATGFLRVHAQIAVVKVDAGGPAFDKTDLLLRGQTMARVAVVVDAGNVSIAAAFDSGLDFVALLDLGGGMPTRVTIPQRRYDEAIAKIAAALDAGGEGTVSPSRA